MVNKSIFKSYDIRGIYPKEINEEATGIISRAFCAFLDTRSLKGPVIIGRDIRMSSGGLYNAAIEAVINSGRDVIEIGIATTPLFYFSTGFSGAAGGIMITASHNPWEYNGMKFVLKDAWPVSYESGLNEVEKIALRGVFPSASKRGFIEKTDFSGEYLDFVLDRAEVKKPLSLVLDSGNGTAGLFLPRLMKTLNISYTPLFFEPDGKFPGRGPNPFLPEAIKPAQTIVRKNKADMGALFDGDADRIVFLDEKGEIIKGDIITALLADEILTQRDLMIFDVRSSKAVFAAAENKNAKAERVKAGHSYIKEAMREKNAVFAGEMSGHYFYRDFYFSDSAFLTLVYILNILSKTEKPFSEIIKPYQKFYHSGELNFKVEDRGAIIQKFKEKYKDGKQSFIDGLTVEYKNWWFNIRPSNTEPLVRLVVEADNKKLIEEKIKDLTSSIK